MIVRIMGEGQFRLDDSEAERLNQLDNEAVAAADAGDEGHWRQLFDEMLEVVRTDGEALQPDELIGSDVIIPPADITLDEARAEFTGEGLIPD